MATDNQLKALETLAIVLLTSVTALAIIETLKAVKNERHDFEGGRLFTVPRWADIAPPIDNPLPPREGIDARAGKTLERIAETPADGTRGGKETKH